MRSEICSQLVALARKEKFFFLTGDLGFMALEPLREALGEWFVNAGLAEQNMVAVAAGLVRAGCQAWVYSIAPFCYARPFEQVRNDICLNNLPVKLVGNGGGYAYGAMGATHHAIEDYGVLLGLQSMRVFVPAFRADIAPVVGRMVATPFPSYLRLGRCELPDGHELPAYSAWRKLQAGAGSLIVAMGPLVGGLLAATCELPFESRPEIWVVSEMPFEFENIPREFRERLSRSALLCIVEEHVAQGGFGQNLVWTMCKEGVRVPRLVHAHARGYVSGAYGSQGFHRTECGLTPAGILAAMGSAPEAE